MNSIEGLTQLAQEQTELIEAQVKVIETREAELARCKHALEAAHARLLELESPASATQQHAQAAQITAKDKSPLPLTDEQVIGVLHSCGIDTYPSVNGFTALQVSATSVPWVREVVRRCMVLIEAADSRVTGNAQAALSDEQIDTIAKPYAGLGGIENYRAFSRAILAASQKSAALADSRSRENENDAPAVQVQDERATSEGMGK